MIRARSPSGRPHTPRRWRHSGVFRHRGTGFCRRGAGAGRHREPPTPRPWSNGAELLNFPYAWGGASAREGFDCSGLTMTVFQLNGLDMPRSLYDQYESGRAVAVDRLSPGDLVFFATGGDEKSATSGLYRRRAVHSCAGDEQNHPH